MKIFGCHIIPIMRKTRYIPTANAYVCSSKSMDNTVSSVHESWVSHQSIWDKWDNWFFMEEARKDIVI